MHKTILSQILDFLPQRQFRRFVERFGGNKYIKSFRCWDQLLCMIFAQLCFRESLRDIEACLKGKASELYSIGIKGSCSRNTLARANEKRPSIIYESLCQLLMKHAAKLYKNDKLWNHLSEAVYILDSSHISFCLSLCPWAYQPKTGSTLKLHALLNAAGDIPAFIRISGSKYRDNMMIDEIPIEAGAFYLMDRAYFDFVRLFHIHSEKAFFVIRRKKKVKFKLIQKLPVDPSTGVVYDRIVIPSGSEGSKKFPEPMRCIKYYDTKKNKVLFFLTNNFKLPAKTICDLYRKRWKIEIFFRWIKQNLRIKKFYGYSRNAVESQIWIALSTYLLIAIIKKRLKIEMPMQKVLQILSVSLFEKKPINTLFMNTKVLNYTNCPSNQLNLFSS